LTHIKLFYQNEIIMRRIFSLFNFVSTNNSLLSWYFPFLYALSHASGFLSNIFQY